MKKIEIIFLCIFMLPLIAGAKIMTVLSPDKSISVTITTAAEITYTVAYKNNAVLVDCPVSMLVNQSIHLGQKPVITKVNNRLVNDKIYPAVPLKNRVIEDFCNEITFHCKGNYSVEFRVYNTGIAYRFVTSLPGQIEVTNETMGLNFAEPANVWFPEVASFYSHYECLYPKVSLSDVDAGKLGALPVLLTTDNGVNVLLSETDLYDYPCLFVKGTGKNHLIGAFPAAVAAVKDNPRAPDRGEIIVKEETFIAKTNGKRSFPWRTLIISDKAEDIVASDLNYVLSRPSNLGKTDWIKSGKAAWDWWNDNNIYGVDFKAGINNDTYKYFIDFASKFGLEYIILDEGWSKTTVDVTENGNDIDVVQLVNYARERGVGIILWLLWKPLDKNLDQILDTYKKWGVKGIKVDFMQRADQYMVNYYERVAHEAAKRELLVDFHGAFKPSGLHRAYPNVVNYEGVRGSENNKWSEDITPNHNVILPFTRMAAGMMDYTPGAMNNASAKDFKISFSRPMSLGTRCHQMAMYVVYESPLQMLCESPTEYYKEEECTRFIAKIPTVWDETRVLAASVGEYLIVARRNEGKWYLGAMTNNEARNIEVILNFLPNGDWKLESMQDGLNVHRNAKDYKYNTSTISNSKRLNINLASGGGWVGIISQ